jgi:hypothetical protein
MLAASLLPHSNHDEIAGNQVWELKNTNIFRKEGPPRTLIYIKTTGKV